MLGVEGQNVLGQRRQVGRLRAGLLRIYHQHATLIELLQYLSVRFTAKSLFFLALETHHWYNIASAHPLYAPSVLITSLATLVAIDSIDAWQLPRSWDDIFEPMFRLTRDYLYDCDNSILMRIGRSSTAI